MKEMVDKGRRPLSIWILLLYVPLGLQLLFWMMGFHYVDFSLPKQFVELPMALIRYYASLTLLLHPLIYAYGLFHSLHLNRTGAKASKVLLSSLLPFASAGPYLIGERIWQYFQ